MVFNGRHVFPARPGGNQLGPEFLAAPGAKNNVGRTLHDLQSVGNDAVFAHRLFGQFGKAVVAAGNADQLGHPGDAADVRVVPFLEKHLGAALERTRRLLDGQQPLLHLPDQPHAALDLPDHRGQLVHHRENLGHAALVEDGDLNTFFDQLRGNVGLQV